ncbi:MAG: HAMP domain-containing sensor histidine kinase [Acidaminococcaceae bacterium]|nr:HAMP domain-containing sensor histidine kinase [Acidaminococcaceae bacterium]
MWNDAIENLRRRLTFLNTVIFSGVIIIIALSSIYFLGSSFYEREVNELAKVAYHEAEEFVAESEKPVSDSTIKDGSLMACIVAKDGETILVDQLGQGEQGSYLRDIRNEWPDSDDKGILIFFPGSEGRQYKYLLVGIPIMDKGNEIGRLYMFKDMEFYYDAFMNTIFILSCLTLLLVLAVSLLAYWLAGRNIEPVRQMYLKQQQFTADASHEMRTPLTVLTLAIDGLRKDDGSSFSIFAREAFAIIGEEVQRLRKLTEDLLYLSRSDEEVNLFEKTFFNFSNVCSTTAEKMQMVAEGKNIALNKDIDENIFIIGNKDSLIRLMVILTDNAIKYSAEKTGILIKAYSKDAKLYIEVIDEGMGISDDDKEKIFDRFYRVDKARSREQNGLGLGLSMAMVIVKKHDGTINVKNNRPCGTIMQVILPLGL